MSGRDESCRLHTLVVQYRSASWSVDKLCAPKPQFCLYFKHRQTKAINKIRFLSSFQASHVSSDIFAAPSQHLLRRLLCIFFASPASSLHLSASLEHPTGIYSIDSSAAWSYKSPAALLAFDLPQYGHPLNWSTFIRCSSLSLKRLQAPDTSERSQISFPFVCLASYLKSNVILQKRRRSMSIGELWTSEKALVSTNLKLIRAFATDYRKNNSKNVDVRLTVLASCSNCNWVPTWSSKKLSRWQVAYVFNVKIHWMLMTFCESVSHCQTHRSLRSRSATRMTWPKDSLDASEEFTSWN